MKITITCDRCKKQIEGIKDSFFDQETNKTYEYTGGYYEIEPNGYWGQFANEGETLICDACMHGDERYKKVYNPPKEVNL